MKTYFKKDSAYLIITSVVDDKISVLHDSGAYLFPIKVTPLKIIVDALMEQFPQVVFDFDFAYELDDERKSSVFLGGCKVPFKDTKTFPELLRGKSTGRLVLFKAFQYRMGSHLESLRVVESHDIPK